MPIFEYICRDCDHRFEALVRGGREPECPACRSQDLAQQLSVFVAAGKRRSAAPAQGACGTCGDPRGPGGCQLD